MGNVGIHVMAMGHWVQVRDGVVVEIFFSFLYN